MTDALATVTTALVGISRRWVKGAGYQEMTVCELLSKNFEDIQVMLEGHGCLLKGLKEGGDTLISSHCVSTCPYKYRLKEVLLETIQVLEESRRAFKSKQLEALEETGQGLGGNRLVLEVQKQVLRSGARSREVRA